MSVAARASWKDAYDAQVGTWRWLRSPAGRAWLDTKFRLEAEGHRPGVREMLAMLFASEESRLLSADPIYVSEGMCELAAAAAETFQPEPLYSTDLLTPDGFLYFARPFPVRDRFDFETTIAAASWSPMFATDPDDEGPPGHVPAGEAFVSVTRDGRRSEVRAAPLDDPAMAAWLEGREGRLDGLALTVYALPDDDWPRDRQGPPPPVVPIHLTPWWFGMSFEGNDFDEQGRPTGAAWWWRVVQSTLRLMQQQLSERGRERPDRAQRRDGARRGFRDREVVVVRLRRERRERPADEGEPANYSHRFIVSGHWRNQWYPASQVHRQIWISPYVKGPEDAPLVVRPRRAFTWTR